MATVDSYVWQNYNTSYTITGASSSNATITFNSAYDDYAPPAKEKPKAFNELLSERGKRDG